MRMDLDRLEDGRLERRFEIGPEDSLLEGYDLDVREPLFVDAVLANPSHRTYVLSARLHGSAEARCRRCLTSTSVPIDETFRTVYQEPGRESRQGDDSGDDDIVWVEPGTAIIEIDDQVRDRLFLEVDRFPVCRGGCKGICPVCGQNLNEEECDCVVEIVDGRWAALESLEFDEREDD